MTHIMGAGIDTFYTPGGQPVAVPVGVVVRIYFDSRDEVGAEHDISVVFRGPDETDLLSVSARFITPPRPAGVPEHWRTTVSLAFRLSLPIPRHGDYALLVRMDQDPMQSRSMDIRAIAPIPGQS